MPRWIVRRTVDEYMIVEATTGDEAIMRAVEATETMLASWRTSDETFEAELEGTVPDLG